MSITSRIRSEFFHPENKKIESELVHLVYSQAGAGTVASLVLATIVTMVLHGVIPHNVLISWYVIMLGIGAIRYLLVKIYLALNPPPEQSAFWIKLLVITIAAAGLTWSCAGTILIPPDGVYQTFITCTLAGMSGSAIPFFAGSRAVCAAYIVTMLTPFIIWLLIQSDLPHEILGLFVTIYLFLLIFSSFRTHRAIYNAIKLKFENDELVKHLSAAQADMGIINQELQTEINERKSAEKLLRDSEEQYRLVTDALPVLISYIDMGFKYRFNNKAHELWFGKPLDEIIGKSIRSIIGHTSYTIFMEHFEKLQDKLQINYETVMQFRDEEERYVSVTLIAHIKDNVMQGLFSLISDMTPRINYLATHDALTDLPNRSLFNARFSQALKRAHRHSHQVALLFLDLDHFKNINDTLGHDVGDHLLIKVVERIKDCLREPDTLARLGGDEFTVILEDITTDAIISIAEKICQAFTHPFLLEGRDVFITTSIGISLYPEDGKEMKVLLKNADMAIYRAKERGRNTFEFYTHELNEKILKKLEIETNLRVAIDNQEFLLYYQPIIDINRNKLCGLEALIRWNHPTKGLILPNDFIPVAEEVGLIVPMGEWVLRSACLQSLIWHKEGLGLSDPIRTSVNLSARQFKEKKLAEMITIILQETGLQGEYITLELTESLIMQDIEYSTRVIKQIKALGIAISIDDFGTGYSSLNYLRRFPIDILKIDRSFIIDVTNNVEDASIVRAIIALAHSLKMKVVAEGVETAEQYNFLKEHECDEIQGYLISKPLPVPEISTFLENNVALQKLLKSIQDNTWLSTR